MATMQATAVISAVDRASPVFMRVAQVAHNAANVYTGLAGRLDAVHAALRNLGTITALPGVMALGAIISKTQEMEKALVGVQIAGISDNIKDGVVDFERLRDIAKETQSEAMRLSKALSLAPTGFVKAGEAALKMGVSADKISKLMELSGSVHIQDRQISQEKATEFLGKMGILFGAGNTGNYEADITKIANQWLAVANMAVTSASRLEDGLRQFAPLFASLGENFGDSASLIGAMTQAGLTDTESGTALKSLATRLLNMTHMGRDAMIVSGLWDEIQKRGLMDMSATSARQATKNILDLFAGRIGKGDQVALRNMLDEGQRNKMFMDSGFQNRLFHFINRATGARDAPTMEANQEKVMTALLTGGGRIKMTEILTLMHEMIGTGKLTEKQLAEIDQGAKLTDAQLAKIGEGRHLSRYKALFKAWDDFRKIRERAASVKDEFTQAGNRIWTTSEAGKWEGTLASIERAFVRFRQSEGIRNAIGMLEQFANTISTMPQGLVEFGGKALVASVGIGALGLALSGVARAAMIVAGNPLMKALFLGGGALALAQPGALMGADRLDARDMLDPTFLGPGAPIWITFDRLSEVGSEFGKIAANIGELAGQIVEAIRIAFGEDPSQSPFMKGLGSINTVLAEMASNAKVVREALEILNGTRTDLSSWQPGLISRILSGGVALPLSGAPKPDGMLRDLGGKIDRVEVAGQAEVNVKSEVTVRVEGPGVVTDTKNGQTAATVPLNPGKSMPDTAVIP